MRRAFGSWRSRPAAEVEALIAPLAAPPQPPSAAEVLDRMRAFGRERGADIVTAATDSTKGELALMPISLHGLKALERETKSSVGPAAPGRFQDGSMGRRRPG